MGADVREAAQHAGGIAREEERLVEESGQQVARRERARRADVAEQTQPLPGAREHAFPRRLVRFLVAIEDALERARRGDVRIDGVFHQRIL